MNWNSFVVVAASKATLVLGAAWCLSMALKRASAASRHLLWALALTAAALLPVLSLSLPEWRARGVGAVIVDGTLAVQAAPAVAGDAGHGRGGRTVPVALLWLGGVVLVLARFSAGAAWLAWTARRARPVTEEGWTRLADEMAAELGLRRRALLSESPRTKTPLVCGIFRPTILLPPEAAAWPEQRRRVVLAHELSHVARRDLAVLWMGQIACAAYWFHPLAWLALSRLRRECERACDDRVLALGARASDYAQHLVDLARSVGAGAALAMARRAGLGERLAAMLDPRRKRGAPARRWALAGALAAAAVLVPLAVVAAQGGGRLYGTVRDPSGAVIPSAKVVVSYVGSGRKEIATAGADGRYSLESLPAGTYRLETRVRGFAVFESQPVTMEPGTAREADITLDVGRTAESIEVVGKRPGTAPPAVPHRIRVGGAVQAGKLVYQVKPEYPDGAQRRGIEGTVMLQAVISTAGDLLSLQPVNTLVDRELVDAAVAAVRQWRYEPTRLNGEPVEVVTTITVNFRLEQ